MSSSTVVVKTQIIDSPLLDFQMLTDPGVNPDMRFQAVENISCNKLKINYCQECHLL